MRRYHFTFTDVNVQHPEISKDILFYPKKYLPAAMPMLYLVVHTGTLSYMENTQPAFTCSQLIIKNTRTRCEIYSKLTIKTSERRRGVVLVSLLLTLNIFHALL